MPTADPLACASPRTEPSPPHPHLPTHPDCAGRKGKTGIATTFINKNQSEQILLDLKHLLKEAKQRVPPVLQALHDPMEELAVGVHCFFKFYGWVAARECGEWRHCTTPWSSWW